MKKLTKTIRSKLSYKEIKRYESIENNILIIESKINQTWLSNYEKQNLISKIIQLKKEASKIYKKAENKLRANQLSLF